MRHPSYIIKDLENIVKNNYSKPGAMISIEQVNELVECVEVMLQMQISMWRIPSAMGPVHHEPSGEVYEVEEIDMDYIEKSMTISLVKHRSAWDPETLETNTKTCTIDDLYYASEDELAKFKIEQVLVAERAEQRKKDFYDAEDAPVVWHEKYHESERNESGVNWGFYNDALDIDQQDPGFWE